MVEPCEFCREVSCYHCPGCGQEVSWHALGCKLDPSPGIEVPQTVGLMKQLHQRVHSPGGAAWKKTAEFWEGEFRAHVRQEMRTRIVAGFTDEGHANQWFLDAVARKWSDCAACPLAQGRCRVVLGSGTSTPDLLIVGAAPGEADEARGGAFLGPDGALLRRVCETSGIELSRVYMTTMVACRPPRDRLPLPTEREACTTRMDEQVGVLRPRLILLLGTTAARWVGLRSVEDRAGLVVPRGSWPSFGGDGGARLRAVFVTHHPSEILKQGTREKKSAALARFADDLKKVGTVLAALKKRKPA